MINETDDPIDSGFEEELASISRRQELWNQHKLFYTPLVHRLRMLEVSVSLSCDLDLSFSGDKAKLASVVRILRNAGFQTTDKKPEANQSYWSARYKHDFHELDFWVSFSSSVCRQVKVGTKMVEQDVYETRCD